MSSLQTVKEFVEDVDISIFAVIGKLEDLIKKQPKNQKLIIINLNK
jgi:hypothetical protein